MSVSLHWAVYLVFFLVSFLYGSVGLGGATGYLAVLSVFGITDPIIAPVVLALNVVVAGISFGQFYGEGYFRLKLLVPFVLTSIPASFLGGSIPISRRMFLLILGVTLLGAGLRTIVMTEVDERSGRFRSGVTFWVVSLGLGVILGLLSGVTGSGGGFLLIPVLLILYRAGAKPTAAAAAGFVVLNSLAGLTGHLWRGHMDWRMTLSLLGAVVLGGFLGSWLGSRYWKAGTVRNVIAIVLILGGGKLLFDYGTLVF